MPAIPHLLVSAYACEPNAGSEPGAGWHILMAASGVAERTTVVTRQNNFSAVSSELKRLGRDDIRVIGIDLSSRSQHWKKKIPIGTQIYYARWQNKLSRVVRHMHERDRFSLGLHATFAVDWLPCGLASVPGLPFVWGPVSGPSLTPWPLIRYLGPRGLGEEMVRRIYTPFTTRIVGGRAARRATISLLQNHDAMEAYARASQAPVLCPNAAADTGTVQRTPDPGLVVGVGRLLPWKGWALALDALRMCPPEVRLVIAGTGPDLHRLTKIANRLGIADRVKFAGWISRDEVRDLLAEASLFLFPSFHDQSPWSLAEAIVAGVPVAGLDLAGPSVLIGAAGGDPIGVSSASKTRAAIASVMTDPPRVGLDASTWTYDALTQRIQSSLMEASTMIADRKF